MAAADFDAPEDHFRADMQPDGLPDLADPAAQRFHDDVIAYVHLIIVDNLSTVCRALRENEADSWGQSGLGVCASGRPRDQSC